MLAEINEQARYEICMHPEAPLNCTPRAIRAHTVQRATGLASIAEDGHVLSGRDAKPKKFSQNDLERIGVHSASTFRGFCSYHDQNTFHDCDVAKTADSRVAFLLGYRALCYELYMKIISISVLQRYRDTLDAGCNFAAQCEIQHFISTQIYTTKVAIDEHSRIKREWDTFIVNKDDPGGIWSILSFDKNLPVTTSGAFYPERNFLGQNIQRLDAPIGSLSLLTFNVTSIAGHTKAIFYSLDKRDPSRNFLFSLLTINNHNLASAIINFCFDASDNIFVKPSWWEQIDEREKRRLLITLKRSLPGNKIANALTIYRTDLYKANVIKKQSNEVF